MSGVPAGKISGGSPFAPLIEEAYRVFDYPTPEELETCYRCCMDPAIEDDFFTHEIRMLPQAYLEEWYAGAVDAQLSKGLWGYLLPRVLESLAAGAVPATAGIEVTLRRFPTGDASRWSPEEWSVIDRFQRAWLDANDYPDGAFLDDVVCMFALAAFPLDDLFAQLEAWPDARLAERLWNDWCAWGHRPRIWISTFWENPNPGQGRLRGWYTSDALFTRMHDLAFDPATPKTLASRARAVAELILDRATAT